MGSRRKELESQLESATRRIERLQRELDAQRGRDELTGLLNVQAFGTRLDAEVERSRRHGRPLCVAVLDIDGFRASNAHHGRAVGDQLIVAAGNVLSRFTRSVDSVSRTSADEFGIVLPETSPADAIICFERILLELEATSLANVPCVSASVGVASYKRPKTSEQLLAEAGLALDRARSFGGGRAAHVDECAETAAPEYGPYHDAISGLAGALLERDRYTGEHSESVVELAAQVAAGLGLDPTEVARVRAAALLHDIGKVAIPDEILNKPGKLDEAEWKLMREHPVIGERILRAIPGLGGVARIVRHEHESWDGSGYPDALAGEEIPVGSRIILACDAYHAMTSDRPYRKAMSHSEAIRELGASADRQFDPRVTEVLIGCLYGRRAMGAAA